MRVTALVGRPSPTYSSRTVTSGRPQDQAFPDVRTVTRIDYPGLCDSQVDFHALFLGWGWLRGALGASSCRQAASYRKLLSG